MLITKLTSKFQATIPEAVRKAIHLGKGDPILFEIKNKTVTLRKATPLDVEFAKSLESTLSEWNSAHDEAAYKNL